MTLDLATEEGAMRFHSLRLQMARTYFETFGHCPPTASVLATTPPPGLSFSRGAGRLGVIEVCAKELPHNLSKDQFTAFIRGLVGATKAIGVLTIIEAWVHHPNRRECVMTLFEHIRIKPRTDLAFISRPADQGARPTLGPFEAAPCVDSFEGRFANLLHQERFA